MRAPARRLAVLAAVLLLAACALAPKFSPPHLSVVDVQLLGGDLFEQRLKVRMRVENPNDRTLPVKGLEYTMEVEGQPFASGASTASFVVPARGQAEFDMNVTTNLAAALLKLLARGADAPGQSVAYRLTGKVSLASGLMRSIPFEERGSFTLQ